MKLSDLIREDSGSATKPTKLSSVMADPPEPSNYGALTGLVRAGREAVSNTVSEFKEGAKTAKEAGADLMRGNSLNPLPALKYLSGGMRELFSPITGTAKAFVGDPLKRTIPGRLGEAVGNTAELGASMVGPSAVSKSLSMVSRALPSYSKAVQTLMDAGVKLTPGQIWQGISKRAEDALRSFPGLGDVIAGGQYHALEDFNRAVLDRALSFIGERLPKNVEIGPQAIQAAEKTIGQRYEKLLPKLTFDAGDPSLAADVATITAKTAKTLPEAQQKQWKAILDDIQGRVTRNAEGGHALDGYTYKQVESELSYLARTYGKSLDPAQKLFADAINDLRGAMRESLERANPEHAAELQSLNSAWAAFSRAQGASIRRVASNGVFSPADLLADIKQSTTRGVFARGDGILQDLASAGQHVLPSTVPDSGTMRRALMAEIAGTGGAAIMDHPNVAIGLATGAAPYTKPGMKLVNKLARGVPKAAAAGNRALNSPIMGLLSGGTNLESQQ